jgi:hypothetical protein
MVLVALLIHGFVYADDPFLMPSQRIDETCVIRAGDSYATMGLIQPVDGLRTPVFVLVRQLVITLVLVQIASAVYQYPVPAMRDGAHVGIVQLYALVSAIFPLVSPFPADARPETAQRRVGVFLPPIGVHCHAFA